MINRFLGLTLIVLVVCAAIQGNGPALNAQKIAGNFSKDTGTKIFKFSFSSPKQKANLNIKADLKLGRAKWTLIAPNGETELTLELGADTGERAHGTAASGNLDYIYGEWTVKIEAEKADGNYEINWEMR